MQRLDSASPASTWLKRPQVQTTNLDYKYVVSLHVSQPHRSCCSLGSLFSNTTARGAASPLIQFFLSRARTQNTWDLLQLPTPKRPESQGGDTFMTKSIHPRPSGQNKGQPYPKISQSTTNVAQMYGLRGPIST